MTKQQGTNRSAASSRNDRVASRPLSTSMRHRCPAQSWSPDPHPCQTGRSTKRPDKSASPFRQFRMRAFLPSTEAALQHLLEPNSFELVPQDFPHHPALLTLRNSPFQFIEQISGQRKIRLSGRTRHDMPPSIYTMAYMMPTVKRPFFPAPTQRPMRCGLWDWKDSHHRY